MMMQGDGNLVFYDSSNKVLYASDTFTTGPATSALVLDGKSTAKGIKFYIYNYAKGEISTTLFPSN